MICDCFRQIALLIFLILFCRSLRTSMNALIINLSIADLINCGICSTLLAIATVGYATGARNAVPEVLCHTVDSFHVLGEYKRVNSAICSFLGNKSDHEPHPTYRYTHAVIFLITLKEEGN